MPCISPPANTCAAAWRPRGHCAPAKSAAQPITIPVNEKRAARNNCKSACGSTAFATMKPVDQINTNTNGMPSRSMFNVSSDAASRGASSKRVQQPHSGRFVMCGVTGYNDQVVQQSGGSDLLIQGIFRVRCSEASPNVGRLLVKRNNGIGVIGRHPVQPTL